MNWVAVVAAFPARLIFLNVNLLKRAKLTKELVYFVLLVFKYGTI